MGLHIVGVGFEKEGRGGGGGDAVLHLLKTPC